MPFCRLSRGKVNLGLLEMAGRLQKRKWAAATITKLAQKFVKKNAKTSENQTFSLPLGRATTTKLAQKRLC